MADDPVRTASPDDLLALENQVCFALAVASRSVIGMYRPLLEPMGLTHPQYLVMLALWERGPHSVRALGEALRLEPADGPDPELVVPGLDPAVRWSTEDLTPGDPAHGTVVEGVAVGWPTDAAPAAKIWRLSAAG